MDELKLKLKELNSEYHHKQLEMNNLYKLIIKIQDDIQNQCSHTKTTKFYNYDGHRSQYYTICQECDKQL